MTAADDGQPEVMPAGRFEWERLVRRIVMPKHVKFAAFILASYADPDGTRVRPGPEVLGAVTGASEKTARRQMTTLTEMGLITMVRRGGGRGKKGRTSEYRLTIPTDLLERFAMLPPGDRGPVSVPVDNSETPDTQTSGESDESSAKLRTSGDRFDRNSGHPEHKLRTPGCPTTSHDQPQPRPDQRGPVRNSSTDAHVPHLRAIHDHPEMGKAS